MTGSMKWSRASSRKAASWPQSLSVWMIFGMSHAPDRRRKHGLRSQCRGIPEKSEAVRGPDGLTDHGERTPIPRKFPSIQHHVTPP